MTLSNIVDNQSNALPSASATVGLLIGDVDANRAVTVADFNLLKADDGQVTDGSNFREDINGNGAIDRNDGKLLRQRIGTSLP